MKRRIGNNNVSGLVACLCTAIFVLTAPAPAQSITTPNLNTRSSQNGVAATMAVGGGVCCIGDGCCVELGDDLFFLCGLAELLFPEYFSAVDGATCGDDACVPNPGASTTTLDLGACCDDGGCCIVPAPLDLGAFTIDVCGDWLGGTFMGVGSDCDSCTGPCCFDDGTCQNLTEIDCLAAGGDFDGMIGWTCAVTSTTFTCPPAWACCLLDGSCELLTEEACSEQSGEWNENDDCSDVTCTPTGACCKRGFCTEDVTQVDCEDNYGDYLGDGSTCEGACCDVKINFENDAALEWPPNDLYNGQPVDGYFSGSFICEIASSGFNNGSAIYDTEADPPNVDDADLRTHPDGNCLILQQKHYPELDDWGNFVRPNDAAEGGVTSIYLTYHSKMKSVELLDVCNVDDEGVTVTLYDSDYNTRTYHVPAGYTSDGDGGRAKLYLNTSSEQQSPVTSVYATVETEEDFNKYEVYKISFDWDGSGGVDNLKFCIPQTEDCINLCE